MDTKADILSRLRQDILSLQGCKQPLYATEVDVKLGPVSKAFPNSTFPIAAIHEFVCRGGETLAATSGFITAILSMLVKNAKPCIWISRYKNVFPPALIQYGIDPGRIIFIHPRKENDLCWAMEEALRCNALGAVIGEMKEIGFTASRRLQLAVEESNITGFIIRDQPKNFATVSDARWQISPLASESEGSLPGVGSAKWEIELLKVRNGKTGKWNAVWAEGRLQFLSRYIQLVNTEKKQTG
jgi:protein ImuA